MKLPNEYYREEVLLGFSEERSYHLVVVRNDFLGEGGNLSERKRMVGCPLN